MGSKGPAALWDTTWTRSYTLRSLAARIKALVLSSQILTPGQDWRIIFSLVINVINENACLLKHIGRVVFRAEASSFFPCQILFNAIIDNVKFAALGSYQDTNEISYRP